MKWWSVALTVALSLLALSGAQAGAPEGTQVLADVAYGPDPKQRLDVYKPAAAHDAPIIVMVHGGGWRLGDKDGPGLLDNKLSHWLPKGYIFVSVNYRLLPEADPLTQADDVAQALALVQARAASWGGDVNSLVLMGHSAGAHLVALLSANPVLAVQKGAQPWSGSVILDSAAVDVEAVMTRRHSKLFDDAFGADPSYWRRASPIVQLTRRAPPMMLVCSTRRKDEPCVEVRAFAAKAAKLGVPTQVSEQALSHREINVQLGTPGAYTDAVDRFIASLHGARTSPL